MLHLESQMRPLVDELEELEQLAQPSDGEKSRQDEITIQLKGMKGEYARADERTKESESAKGIYLATQVEAEPARARTDRQQIGTSLALDTSKGWFDTVVESKSFKRGIDDIMNVRESMPLSKLFPGFSERKAVFIPGNLDRSGGLVDVFNEATQPRRRHSVLELIRTVPTNQYNINYLPLTFTNNAASVALGQPKPESTNTGQIETLTQTTIAHWKETVRQVLKYIPQLRGEIETELSQGVLDRLENRVIHGTGIAPQMKGVLAQVTNTAAGADLLAQLFNAVSAVEWAGGVVDAIVVNPLDWGELQQYEYLNNAVNPVITATSFNGYPVVKSRSLAAGQAIVGDWSMAVVLYVGDALRVDVTEALGFKSNIVTFRAEMDAVVLVSRPWLMYVCDGPLPAPPGGGALMARSAQTRATDEPAAKKGKE
jgi:hypothetical protein